MFERRGDDTNTYRLSGDVLTATTIGHASFEKRTFFTKTPQQTEVQISSHSTIDETIPDKAKSGMYNYGGTQ